MVDFDFRTAQPRATAKTHEVDQGLRSYMLRVYNYMGSALCLTGIVALVIFNMSVSGFAPTGPTNSNKLRK